MMERVALSAGRCGSECVEYSPKLNLTNKEELRKYLPYSRELPSYIRTLSKSEIKAILNEANSQV